MTQLIMLQPDNQEKIIRATDNVIEQIIAGDFDNASKNLFNVAYYLTHDQNGKLELAKS